MINRSTPPSTVLASTLRCLVRPLGLAMGIATFLTHGAIAAPTEISTVKQDVPDVTGSDVRFTCEYVNGQYTVMYHPASQADQMYAWATPTEMGGGWTPERRCAEISRRLEFYRPDGLQELSTSVENGYDIVCVTTQADPTCRIVFTVPPGQDPQITRDRVFENLTVADAGQRTDSVVTFTDNGSTDFLGRIGDALNLNLNLPSGRRESGINLRPFLDPADGGTGARLQNGVAVPSGRRLNTDGFR